MQPSAQSEKLIRLLDHYSPALWRLVNSYETESGRREDLYQDIALGLWQAIPRFRGEASERTWLYRIAHNIAISTLDSRRRRERRELPMTDPVERASTAENPSQALVAEERRQAMQAAIRELPAIDKQIILLHLEGLSYQEIEQVSGLSESAIASRLSRIRDRLTELIRKKEIRNDSAIR